MKPFALGIPTYCNYPLLHKLLDSINRSPIKPAQTIIVDNSRQLYLSATNYSFPITVVRSSYNYGCAKSWNVIGKLTRPMDVIISNDDMEVIPGVSFEKLLEQNDAMVHGWGYSFFLMREEAWRRIGYFDEAIWPVYWEDTDYSWKRDSVGMGSTDLGLKYVLHTGQDHTQKTLSYGGTNRWLDRNRDYVFAKWGITHTPKEPKPVYKTPWNGSPVSPMEWEMAYNKLTRCDPPSTALNPRAPDEDALWHHLSLIQPHEA